MKKEFLECLNKSTKKIRPINKDLQKFVSELSEWFGKPVKCELILGGITEYGQEYRVNITLNEVNYSNTLFRVYFSQDNKITFHQSGGKIEKNILDLNARLLQLLENSTVFETLNFIKEQSKQSR